MIGKTWGSPELIGLAGSEGICKRPSNGDLALTDEMGDIK